MQNFITAFPGVFLQKKARFSFLVTHGNLFQKKCLFSKVFFFWLLFSYMPVFSKQTSNYAKVTGLRCEYLINPIGIDSENPRFSWMIADARNGAKQEAYQVFVGTDSISISHGRGRNWQTNPINLPVQLITYQGNKLRAFTKYFWSVRIWDKEGKGTALAPVASFETGMMGTKNWRGSWISDIADINIKPAGYFRKEFEASKRIRSARAYIVAAGFYELSINGKKID